MRTQHSHNQAAPDIRRSWRIFAENPEKALIEMSASLTRTPAGQVSHEIERCLPYLVLMPGGGSGNGWADQSFRRADLHDAREGTRRRNAYTA